VRIFAERFAGLAEVESNHPSQQPYWLPPFPGLRAQAWHDPDTFPWATGLKAALPDVLEELEQLLSQGQDFMPYLRNPTGATWSLFPLQYMGVPVQRFADCCPRTQALVHALPDHAHEHIFGDLAFSRLTPGLHLPTHYSADSLRIRCHLGLKVDNSGPLPWLRVADQICHWEVGQLLAFDDGFEHEASNPSASTRIVLIADFWHPDLTPPERQALIAAFSPVPVRALMAATRAPEVDASMLKSYAASDTSQRRAGLWDS
jgi:aspartyl/asparaginyl beta-hydroxylase (cupin superfamily)